MPLCAPRLSSDDRRGMAPHPYVKVRSRFPNGRLRGIIILAMSLAETEEHASNVNAYVAHERDVEVEAWDGIVNWRTLVSSDRTPTHAMTVGTAEIPVGASVEGARHRHAEPETYYVISGYGDVFLGDEPRPVEPGSAVFVPGGVWHYVQNTGSIPLKLVYAFAVDHYAAVRYEFADSAGFVIG